MAKPLYMKLDGIEDLNAALRDLAPREATNLLRTTVHGIAGEAVDRVEQAAPYAHLRKGFRAVRRRGERGKPVSEVRAKASAADWRFAEFGTGPRYQKTTGRYAGRMPATPFVTPQVETLRREMPDIYREQFGKKLEAQLARRAKRMKTR